MQQAKECAVIWDIPLVYSSNGDAFSEFDKTKAEGEVETELTLDRFPSPEELRRRYANHKNLRAQLQEIVKEETKPAGSGFSGFKDEQDNCLFEQTLAGAAHTARSFEPTLLLFEKAGNGLSSKTPRLGVGAFEEQGGVGDIGG